ncbi:DUF4389 domain-containing protein [Kribbella sindirgiensis]|uniref:DUF4389 domain-containing protein n=1 Tax=Kribbella sindirgiensis TaxID=1124744 RepID=A0A4R0IA66_9ACTN|nr:DUF4389 domain-containing protein [Kribbella sindirgiensis]TCC24352.1 DUF4389 domain-containing protein [Kribbella sindirgiensis]
MSTTTYPVRVDGALDDRLNRWLWLVKWVLVIPHLFVLAVLWIAFALLSFVAFFAILFTGRYPRGIFDFNVGVLRWSWRVQFYAYGALGTDKYPPFTLHDVPDYPAHLEVKYPEHLSRGLVLVKWWLLAIPHYIVVAFFVGSGTWFATQADDRAWAWGGGLVGLLVLVAAIVLLFTGRYPRSVFDFVLGMNRWALRVAAYAGLMVDEYPPFRLDMGGDDPGTTKLHEPPSAGPPPVDRPLRQPGEPGRPGVRMTAGRIVTLVVGVVVTLASVTGLAVGGALAWLDEGRRDSAGFVTSGQVTLSTTGYALTSENFTIDIGATTVPRDWFGDVRIRVASTDGVPVFVGLARSADVETYLAGVGYATVRSIGTDRTTYDDHAGGAPSSSPAELEIWRVQSSGPGEQTITWPVENGDWTLVVMAADGSANIGVRADVGATAPSLEWAWIAVLASAGLTLLLGVALVVVAVVRRPQPGPSALQGPPPAPME